MSKTQRIDYQEMLPDALHMCRAELENEARLAMSQSEIQGLIETGEEGEALKAEIQEATV